MDVTSPEPNRNSQTDRYPLLMEQSESHHQHIIDITRNGDALSNSSHVARLPEIHLTQNEDQQSSGTRDPTNQTSSSSRLNSRNSSTRGEGYRHRRRNPLNSGLWISVELVATVGQIIASIVVLSLSRNENPQAPLFAWIVGYTSGCVAMLPILYWRYRSHNQSSEQDTPQQSQGSSGSDHPLPTSYTAISNAHVSDEENGHVTESAARSTRIPGAFFSRLNGLVDHFKMALDCFFAVWFVLGNVWIFGGHSSPSDAPKLYRLCIVFLTFSCIGYAMPFILCATICCCLPCIISVLGIREDFSQTRGATVESINALPIYKFKLKKTENSDNQDVNTAIDEGGIFAAGTEKERAISGEDAVCCICLAKYADNDDLRELPCLHFFHVACVDKWLKINASCPLCKSDAGKISGGSPSAGDSSSV
ncbi:E3 ubiquitin-protein ligase At1g63170-like isoform X2 [Neltuma alba]|uniref:E3 ubiquitin-protein ligase At1g63170-like isoform X2 n=1 Tax=Neltuma alba TaxID=207710 RepID=UPI0010A2D455|nr:E3 ubiquitin-protein ligase At1g63170-like isoform X2 [Prosopis alba]